MSATTAPVSLAPRVTSVSLAAQKQAGRPVVMLTAYDFHSARLVEAAGIDCVLVGDSLGMTMLGHDSTLPVTMEDMVRATRSVSSACTRVLVVADMPFMSYQADYAEGMHNAGRLLAEGHAHAVKVEGASADTLSLVAGLTDAGVPVMGHIGLTPQSVNVLGGYRTQARDVDSAARAIADAFALQEAGAFALVLECVPAELATRISDLLAIPTIGIGAGAGCDGQVQVFHDLLGLGDFLPKHAVRYAELGSAVTEAVSRYADDVRGHAFPGEQQTVHMDAATVTELDAVIAEADDIFAGLEDGEVQ